VRDSDGAALTIASLARSVLVVLGRFPGSDGELHADYDAGDGRAVPLEARSLSYGEGDGAAAPAPQLVLIRCPEPPPAAGAGGHFLLRSASSVWVADPARAMIDLKALARAGLAALEPAMRARILAFLVSALDWDLAADDGAHLSASLRTLRDALRERLPYCATTEGAARALHVDAVVTVDASTFYLRGWMADREAPIVALAAVSPEGVRIDLSDRCSRSGDVRVDLTGMFRAGRPSRLCDGWTFEMWNAAGLGHEVRAPRVVGDIPTAIRAIVEPLATRTPADAFMREHVVPAVSRLQKRLRGGAATAAATQFGTPAESPGISVVVVLDERLEPLEHHLAAFVHDPRACQADLVYVAQPGAAPDGEWADRAARMFELYRVPFRLVALGQPAGFAGAVDAGLAFAVADVILLLDPDVIPAPDWGWGPSRDRDGTAESAGWLGPLEAGYRHNPATGAFGVPLVRADEASSEGITTGAVVIGRDRLRQLGGLTGDYLRREAEIADLCRRVAAAGLEYRQLPGILAYDVGASGPSTACPDAEAAYDEWLRLSRPSSPASTAGAARRRTGSAT
jgi:hypothetical protein